ncbi:MAG TPA: phosphatidate cytidylyltransferase [bacterium]|nr:phosphatidate cytidylyltransferase [bacterium]
MVRTRFLSTLVAAPILAWFIWYGSWPFLILIITAILLGLFEFYNMPKVKGLRILRITAMACGVALALYAWRGNIYYLNTFLTASVLLLLTMQLFGKRPLETITNLSYTILGLIYVGWLFSHQLLLRNVLFGREYILLLFWITWSGDIGAYAFGTILGKHKLIPRVSPRKSVEGAVGGLFLSLTSALLAYFLLEESPFLGKWLSSPGLSLLHYLILGLILGIVGQFGDLCESLLKRGAQIKDAGGIIPGHGGLLDVMDSLLFTSPVMYYYIVHVVGRLRFF